MTLVISTHLGLCITRLADLTLDSGTPQMRLQQQASYCPIGKSTLNLVTTIGKLFVSVGIHPIVNVVISRKLLSRNAEHQRAGAAGTHRGDFTHAHIRLGLPVGSSEHTTGTWGSLESYV